MPVEGLIPSASGPPHHDLMYSESSITESDGSFKDAALFFYPLKLARSAQLRRLKPRSAVQLELRGSRFWLRAFTVGENQTVRSERESEIPEAPRKSSGGHGTLAGLNPTCWFSN